MFYAYDEDGSGGIEKAEMKDFVRKILPLDWADYDSPPEETEEIKKEAKEDLNKTDVTHKSGDSVIAAKTPKSDRVKKKSRE